MFGSCSSSCLEPLFLVPPLNLSILSSLSSLICYIFFDVLELHLVLHLSDGLTSPDGFTSILICFSSDGFTLIDVFLLMVSHLLDGFSSFGLELPRLVLELLRLVFQYQQMVSPHLVSVISGWCFPDGFSSLGFSFITRSRDCLFWLLSEAFGVLSQNHFKI